MKQNPARDMALRRWAKTTKEQRLAHAHKMVAARRRKREEEAKS